MTFRTNLSHESLAYGDASALLDYVSHNRKKVSANGSEKRRPLQAP
jgi:hypothetical protein